MLPTECRSISAIHSHTGILWYMQGGYCVYLSDLFTAEYIGFCRVVVGSVNTLTVQLADKIQEWIIYI